MGDSGFDSFLLINLILFLSVLTIFMYLRSYMIDDLWRG